MKIHLLPPDAARRRAEGHRKRMATMGQKPIIPSRFVCEQCGSVFYRRACKNACRFCSRDCTNKFLVRENNPSYVHGLKVSGISKTAWARLCRARYPIKTAARMKFRNAVQSGKIKRQPCSVCGDPKGEGHHEDYSKPYDVIWLCSKHHHQLHKERYEAAKSLASAGEGKKP